MKNLNLLTFCSAAVLNLGITGSSHGQAPGWDWVKVAGQSGDDIGRSITTDGNENVYVTGSFRSQYIHFGNTSLGNTGGSDIFILKSDAAGNVIWAESAGGTDDDAGYGIATDPKGNVFVAGHFKSGSIRFGPHTLTNAGNGATDIFIVKYDQHGNVVWARSAGGIMPEDASGITTDAVGNVLVTGSFRSTTIDFGGKVLTNKGGHDTYLVKYDPAGNVLWARSADARGVDYGRAVGCDAGGNVYACGVFNSDSISFGALMLRRKGFNDIFLVKYDATGNAVWARSAASIDNESVHSIVVDGNGNPIITGSFYGNSLKMENAILYNHGYGPSDLFVVKYDPAGQVQWARSAGGSEYDDAISSSTDKDGNVYVSGRFNSYSMSFGKFYLQNAPGFHLFLVKYNASGNVLWATSTSGSAFGSREVTHGIRAGQDGNVYLAGESIGQSVFGKDTTRDQPKLFIAKISEHITGITPHAIDKKLNVFPNPSNGIFRIEGLESGKWEISIFSVEGKCVYSSAIREQAEVDLTARTAGIYFYRISNGHKIHSGKIAIE
jgi:hypothetical protein